MNITLEAFSKNHLPNTFEWMQDESLKKDFMISRVITAASHQLWFDALQDDHTQKIWAICHEGVHVGNIGLKNIDYKNHKAETWIYLGNKEVKGKGIGAKSYDSLFNSNEFGALGMHKIYCFVAEWNIASQKTFLNAGFKEEAVLGDELFQEGKYYSLKRYCIYTAL